VTSSETTINLDGFTPALFSTNQQGAGQGAILIANTASISAAVDAFPGSRAAHPGESVSIYCTGLGTVINQPATG
jgi:uncharacterized protein (TIGR03437 family)